MDQKLKTRLRRSQLLQRSASEGQSLKESTSEDRTLKKSAFNDQNLSQLKCNDQDDFDGSLSTSKSTLSREDLNFIFFIEFVGMQLLILL